MSKVVLLDGGMSRELMHLEALFRQPKWSALVLMEPPHLVEQVHTEFAGAGAEVLTMNSYASIPFHIGEKTFCEHGEKLAQMQVVWHESLLMLPGRLLILVACHHYSVHTSLTSSSRASRQSTSIPSFEVCLRFSI
jgi:S-methylmethionine-dependent homocysteine/selenocysteine methylase